jgi:hypothetical protein
VGALRYTRLLRGGGEIRRRFGHLAHARALGSIGQQIYSNGATRLDHP